jgi:hypothetical protein
MVGIVVRLVAVVAAVLMAAGLTTTAVGAATGNGHHASPKASLSFRATGYFRIASADGRSWLVTPTGQPFYSSGIDHVTASPDVDQTTGQCPYCQTIAGEYPNLSDWATATVARLRSWGFNSLGAFSDDTTFGSQMPYSVQLGMASGDDWFAPSFVTNADQVAATQVAPLAHDPNLIGFYTDSELHWGPDGSDYQPVLDNYLALPAGSPGLAVAQQYVGNPNGFVYALATRYFQVTTAAVRMYDKNHLILGVKAEAQEIQPQLLEAAKPYVDVFSIDDYSLVNGIAQIIDKIWPQYLPVTSTFSDFEHYVRRPIMVGEYSFIASGPATPDTVPGVYAVYPTQAQRAAAYTNYIEPLYEHSPWVVGDEWFEYVDEPAGGRFDGENNNFGVVDVEDQPYQDLVTQMELAHSVAPDRVVTAGPTCDSWADGTGGVVCTATTDPAGQPLSVSADSLPTGTAGTPYSGFVNVIGGRPTYSITLSPASPLPPGLRFRLATGSVTGTPRTVGSYPFTVSVTDDSAPTPLTSTVTLNITIDPPPLSIRTTSLRPAVEGARYCRLLTTRGGTAPITWSVSAGALPAGLTLADDGALGGRASVSGTFSFTVVATDSSTPARAAHQALSLAVNPATSSGSGRGGRPCGPTSG